jgi:hypothetical protein
MLTTARFSETYALEARSQLDHDVDLIQHFGRRPFAFPRFNILLTSAQWRLPFHLPAHDECLNWRMKAASFNPRRRERMRSQGQVSSLARPFCLCVLLASCVPVLAEPGRHQTKIICRDEVAVSRRKELADKLRTITGWTDLGFDNGGSLQPGINPPIEGSETARVLLGNALTGANIFILEDASNRADVVFSKVVPGRWKSNDSQGPPVFVVLIDFADFDHLTGDRPALAAFDVGWGVLHEIDHVVNDLKDSNMLGQVGDCEGQVNEMRRELRLPERSEYFFTFFPHSEQSDFSTRYVRLAFDHKDGARKPHRYWLIWNAVLVGGLDDSKQIAELR